MKICEALNRTNGIVSLLDMLRFYADLFVITLSQISILKKTLGYSSRLTEEQISAAYEGLNKALDDMKGYCQEMALPLSVMSIEQTESYISENRHNLSVSRIGSYIDITEGRILDELHLSHFFSIPKENIAFYESPAEQFGQQAIDHLPGAIYDIEEAGKCLALGRSTATIFHLMRVMELAVQELGTKLGVSLASEQNWQVILDQINAGIKRLPNNTREEKEIQGRHAACASHLFNVKVAWRNDTMHPRAKYTEEEAHDIFSHVRIFTRYFVSEILL